MDRIEGFYSGHTWMSVSLGTDMATPNMVDMSHAVANCPHCGSWRFYVRMYQALNDECRRCGTFIEMRWYGDELMLSFKYGGTVHTVKQRFDGMRDRTNVASEIAEHHAMMQRLVFEDMMEKAHEEFKKNFKLPRLELGANKKKSMSLNSIAKRLLDEDTRILVKAGYLNSELDLTDEGIDVMNAMEFEAHKPKLVEAAKQKLADAKAEK